MLYTLLDHGNGVIKFALSTGTTSRRGVVPQQSFQIIVFMVSCSVEQEKVWSIGILNITINSPANKKENKLEIACACNFSLELRALLALNLLQENCILFCYNLLIILLRLLFIHTILE